MQIIQPRDDNDLLAEALACQDRGQSDSAVGIFRDLVQRHNGNPRLLHFAGTAELQASNFSQAIALLEHSIEIDPNQADTHSHIGVAYWNLGDYAKSAAAYKAAIGVDKNYADAYNNLCMVMQDGYKRPDIALKLVDRAIQIRPDFADAYNNRGNVLQALERTDEALASYDRALALKPESASAHNNRGNALRKLDRASEALSAYQAAIALKPEYAEAFCNMGCTLVDLGQMDDARRFYQQSLVLDPNFAKAFYNLGSLEGLVGNHELALQCYNKAIKLDPNCADAYWNKALLQLVHGNYHDGFALYEWGWKNQIRGQRRGFSQQEWLGQFSIAGKQLLIHQEQGIGDCIHYVRYVRDAVDMGAEVILECVAPLIPLLEGMNIPCSFVPLGHPLPDFDCYIPLMSLPLAMGTTLENVPAEVPYLFADPVRTKIWQQRLGQATLPRVGLVWSGSTLHKNDHKRSMGLKELLPLLALPLEFHCLQKEIRPEDEWCLPALPMIHRHDAALNDFADTAALVSEMDLVISVDTSVAHVAGAMGKPTWILLPNAPDWRWLLDRQDSPWYPTARLFRQDTSGAWSTVIESVRESLLTRYALVGDVR